MVESVTKNVDSQLLTKSFKNLFFEIKRIIYSFSLELHVSDFGSIGYISDNIKRLQAGVYKKHAFFMF